MRKSLLLVATTLSFVCLLAACEGADSLPVAGDTGGGGGSDDTGDVCVPACEGRECGSDGCGGSCGAGCAAAEACNANGVCVPTTCQPVCTAKECGDDGCGGTCGTCGRDAHCSAAGQCIPDGCEPDCAGKDCGGDGCGGTCGTCGGNETCEDGACVSTVCVPQCDGRQCGLDPACQAICGTCRAGDVCRGGQCECAADCAGRECGDDGCGGTCGGCGGGETCNALGQCIDATCVADCDGVECGPDPVCGQSCGGCAAELNCVENTCVCLPNCVGRACGTDSCGGSCGTCGAGLECVEGICACVPSCAGKECGGDGCGGTCGTCDAGETCQAGQCRTGTCTPDCAGKECGDNGCDGSCGTCDAGETCQAGQCVGGGGPLVDAPCTGDADCGTGGTCLDFDGFFPGGYCSVDCAETDCPEGSGCWSLGEDVGSFCLHTCAASSECREGYYCDADDTCWPGTEPTGEGLVGTPCASDTDCDGSTCYPEVYDGEPTGFVDGYCVIFGCSDTVTCPAGSGCYELTSGETVCLDQCTTAAQCRDGYACDGGVCWPACTADSCGDGYVCNEETGLCEVEPCTAGSCPDGQECVDGRCVADVGEGPGAGPGPTCADLPPLTCTGTAAYCGEIVPFEPDQGDGWDDYALNGETMANEYRSYLRRDLMMAVKYAAAKVRCKLGDWDFGNGPDPIGLGDMSEANGDIPGTSVGEPGHPEGTHTDGFDMDLGYYQVGTADNHLRPICEHTTGGQEQYHCTAPPTSLDPWRTALFMAYLSEHPQVRVIGCDGQAGGPITTALTRLCQDGWTPSVASCTNPSWSDFPVTYEVTNEGNGWYYFHHHHFHVSFSGPGKKTSEAAPPAWCLTDDCDEVSVLPLPRYDLKRLPRITGKARPF